MITNELTLIGVFFVVGIFTFCFRAIFLYEKPRFFKSDTFRNGLDAVPSALLVALVIPFTFFVSGAFLPFRIQVLTIILTFPIIYYLKKPGLSLPIAIFIYIGLSITQTIFII